MPNSSLNHILDHTSNPMSNRRELPETSDRSYGSPANMVLPTVDSALPPPSLASHASATLGDAARQTSSQPEAPLVATQAAPTRDRTENLFACSDCGRSYSRPEHLVRHVQIHTLGRRFQCEICSKAFARKDLLRRHVANHQTDSSKKRKQYTAASNEGRVSFACKPCASARVKCDDVKPCRRCVNRRLDCVPPGDGLSTTAHQIHQNRGPASLADTTSSASASPVDQQRCENQIMHEQHQSVRADFTSVSATNDNLPSDRTSSPTVDSLSNSKKVLISFLLRHGCTAPRASEI